jgi:hypothetical protein
MIRTATDCEGRVWPDAVLTDVMRKAGLIAEEPRPLVLNDEMVGPEDEADQQQPTQNPMEWVRGQRAPLIGIPELSNPVQCVLSQHLVSLFRVAQPLAIRHELPSTPPKREVVEDDQHTQQQKIEQVSPDYSTIISELHPTYGTGWSMQ